MKIRKGDNVIMIAGKDKNKTGKVIKVFPKEDKVIVENINLKKKHQRAKTGGKKGEKIEVPRPVSVASVMLVCKSCGKPTRASYQAISNKKLRICKKCKSEI